MRSIQKEYFEKKIAAINKWPEEELANVNQDGESTLRPSVAARSALEANVVVPVLAENLESLVLADVRAADASPARAAVADARRAPKSADAAERAPKSAADVLVLASADVRAARASLAAVDVLADVRAARAAVADVRRAAERAAERAARRAPRSAVDARRRALAFGKQCFE